MLNQKIMLVLMYIAHILVGLQFIRYAHGMCVFLVYTKTMYDAQSGELSAQACNSVNQMSGAQQTIILQ